MDRFSQVQTVPRNVLEDKIGNKLSLNDRFTTKTGTWEVIDVTIDDKTNVELLTVERKLI